MYNADEKKRATIKDVAQLAGVSIGTVSHVINGTASISEETKANVNRVIKELNYVPNSAARIIRTKNNMSVGVLVPKFSNTFYGDIVNTIAEEAAKKNVIVQTLTYEFSLEREIKEIESLIQSAVNTVIILNGDRDEKYIKRLTEHGIQVILGDRSTDLENIPYIAFDNISGVGDAISYLKNVGYKSIGLISEPFDFVNLRERFEGYRKGLIENGYEYNPDYVYIVKDIRKNYAENSHEFMMRLLREKGRGNLPEAFITSSDLIAYGVIKAILDSGYKIPEDVGIIGLDDLEMSAFWQPPLSTIRQDREELGRLLWQMAYDGLSGKKIESHILNQELIIRRTCR